MRMYILVSGAESHIPFSSHRLTTDLLPRLPWRGHAKKPHCDSWVHASSSSHHSLVAPAVSEALSSDHKMKPPVSEPPPAPLLPSRSMMFESWEDPVTPRQSPQQLPRQESRCVVSQASRFSWRKRFA